MLFNLLQVDVDLTSIPVVNLSDSLKTTTKTIIADIQSHPDTFFQDLLSKAVNFGLKVVLALVVYIVGAWLIRLLKSALRRYFDRKKTEKTVESFVMSLVSILLTVLLIMTTIGMLGINTTSIAAILAAGGMALGVAMSGTLQNFAGGMMILVFKPFKAGDFIAAQGCSGTVTEVNIVNTKIRTTDNREIILPNGTLFNGNIDNYSIRPLRRVEWVVGVEYDSDADKCMEIIMGILRADERVLDATVEGAADPAVMLSSLNENDISFTARAWTKSENYWDLFYDVNLSIYKKLPENGFSFAYPHMDVTISPKDKE